MKKSAIKELLMAGNFLAINKTVMQKLGLETAVLLSSFAEADRLSNDGWFYQTIETVEKHTTLSRHKQDKAIAQLEELHILKTDRRGIPAKRYFKINYDTLSAYLFAKNSQASLSKINKLECKKLTTNKDIINKEIDKDIKKNSASKESTTITKQEVEDNFEKMWKLYPKKRNKGQVSFTKKKEIFKLGDEFERCISRYVQYVEKERKSGFKELQFQNGSTFFNSGYVDFLDENYSEDKSKEAGIHVYDVETFDPSKIRV